MDTSILRNVKKMLGIAPDDESFDLDIILHINAAFSILHGLGIGPVGGFTIEDDTSQWEDFVPTEDPALRNLIKTCIFLRVRLSFDAPQTSYLIAALEKQIAEHEWRLSEMREQTAWVDPDPPGVYPRTRTIVSTFEEVIGE